SVTHGKPTTNYVHQAPTRVKEKLKELSTNGFDWVDRCRRKATPLKTLNREEEESHEGGGPLEIGTTVITEKRKQSQ
ncbi:hypothetical protein CCACVL1_03909, partial [Corchorus capsularis]